MGVSVIDAHEVKVEELKQKQYVSDVHVGVIFGGEHFNVEHNGHCSMSEYDLHKFCSECGDGQKDNFSGYSIFIDECMKESGGDAHRIHIGRCGLKLFSRYGVQNGNVGFFSSGDILELVSKAVKSVEGYINSLSDVNSGTTNLHFYIIGFDYGAACARLFGYLLVRGKVGGFKYEADFSFYSAKRWFKNGHLNFLENYRFGRKIVESVGLYDTENSIGYLGKKDGTIRIYKL